MNKQTCFFFFQRLRTKRKLQMIQRRLGCCHVYNKQGLWDYCTHRNIFLNNLDICMVECWRQQIARFRWISFRSAILQKFDKSKVHLSGWGWQHGWKSASLWGYWFCGGYAFTGQVVRTIAKRKIASSRMFTRDVQSVSWEQFVALWMIFLFAHPTTRVLESHVSTSNWFRLIIF